MPHFRYTDEIPFPDLTFSKVHYSRKSEGRKYVYVKLDDHNIEIETPKMRVADVHSSDGRCVMNLDLTSDDQAKVMKQLLARWSEQFAALGERFKWINNKTPADSAPILDTWQVRIVLEGPGKTLFYDHSTKKQIEEEPDKRLRAASVAIIAILDGIVIDDIANLIKPVWSVDQVLVYPQDDPNPFGKTYSFLDDDDGYLSLED